MAAWLVRLFFGLFLLLVYLTISAEGLRALFDTAALPVHKTGLWPLTYFGGFAETRKLDLAHVLCLPLMVCVWVSWEQIVCYFGAERPELTNARRLVWAAGTVVLLCDTVLFWLGISQAGVLGGSSVFAATVVTALYTGMLVLVATWTNMIEGRIR
jgi:hypothetical protein